MNHLTADPNRAAVPVAPEPAELQLYEVRFSVSHVFRRDVYARDPDEAVALVRALRKDCDDAGFRITATDTADMTARLVYPAPTNPTKAALQ